MTDKKINANMNAFYETVLGNLDFLTWDMDLKTGEYEPYETAFMNQVRDQIFDGAEGDLLHMIFENLERFEPANIKDFCKEAREGKHVKSEVLLRKEGIPPHNLILRVFPYEQAEDGTYTKAAFTIEEMQRDSSKGADYADQFEYFHTLATRNAIFCIRADLTDSVLLEDLIEEDQTQTFDEIMENHFIMDSLGADNKPLRDHMSRDVLLAHQAAGHWKLSNTFRFVNSNPMKLRYIKVFARVLENPYNGHIEAFMYAYDDSDGELTKLMMNRMAEVVYAFTAIIDPAMDTIRFVQHPRFKDHENIPYEESVKWYCIDNKADFEEINSLISIERILKEVKENDSYALILENGEERRMLYQFSWLNAEEELLYLFVTDVTDQYRKDQESMRQVKEALKSAEEANHAKTEFVSRISHDIRTPIGAILNLTEFARQDVDEPEKLENDLNKIATSGRFLLSLINDVLDIAKINSGKIELHPTSYCLEEYVSEIRNIMEPMCEEKGLRAVFDTEDLPDVCVKVDRVRLNQVTLNILSNAVKYTGEGAVSFIAKGVEHDGMVDLKISVKDTGIGMSEEYQTHMFEEFSQESSNPNRQEGMTGTGLGLPIVKKLLDLMGGTVSVDSELGKGTDVTFTLSREVCEPEDTETEITRSVNTSFHHGRILFAEDNDINTEIAARYFEMLGVNAEHAADGSIAVQKFVQSEEGYYDVIFMDIQMPNMNGYEASKAIRALDRGDALTVPIIALTADAFADAMQKAKDAGMSGYMTKPLDIEKIREVLEQYIQ